MHWAANWIYLNALQAGACGGWRMVICKERGNQWPFAEFIDLLKALTFVQFILSKLVIMAGSR